MPKDLIHILRYLSNVKKNALLSPLGLEIVLRILAEGTSGIRREALCKVLGIEAQENALAPIIPIQEVLKNLPSVSTYKNQTLLEYAPGILVQIEFLEKIGQVLPFFAQQADATTLDFAFRLENNFSIEAEWKKAFKEIPHETEFFTLKDGNKVETAFIEQSNIYGGNENLYYKSKDFHAVRIPMKDEQLCLEVYLPYKKEGLEPMLEQLDGAQLQAIADQFESVAAMQVILPKFKLEEKFKLNDALQTLGLTSLFEFSEDFRPAFASEVPLKIQEVRQEVTFELDEMGLKAGAKTVVSGVGGASVLVTLPYVLFEANQPFLYLIREKQTKKLLFLGLYEEPDRQQDFAHLHENEQRNEFWIKNSVYSSNRMILVVFIYSLEKIKAHTKQPSEAYSSLIDQLWNIVEATRIVEGRMLIKKAEEELKGILKTLDWEEELLTQLFEDLTLFLEELKDKRSRKYLVGTRHLYHWFYQLSALGYLIPSTNLLAHFEKSIEGDAWGPVIPRSFLSKLNDQTLVDPGLMDSQVWERVSAQLFRSLKPKVVPLTIRAKVYLGLICLNRVVKNNKTKKEEFKPLVSDILRFVSEGDIHKIRAEIGALHTFGEDYQTGIYKKNKYFTKEAAEQLKYANLNGCKVLENICQSINYFNQMLKNPEEASMFQEQILDATLSNLNILRFSYLLFSNLNGLEQYSVEEGKDILGPPIEIDSKQIKYLLD